MKVASHLPLLVVVPEDVVQVLGVLPGRPGRVGHPLGEGVAPGGPHRVEADLAKTS